MPEQPLSKPRALLVEDDVAVGRAIGRMLSRVGFDVAVSLSGAHALARVREGERFQLVVSDVNMPGLDGPSFREAARSVWPGIDAILIFVSGACATRTTTPPCFAKPLREDFFEHVRKVHLWASGAAVPG